jgi:hypothetical protein
MPALHPFESSRELNQHLGFQPIEWQAPQQRLLVDDVGWGRHDAVYNDGRGRRTAATRVPIVSIARPPRTPVRSSAKGRPIESLSASNPGQRELPARQDALGTHEFNTGYRLWWVADYLNPDSPDQVGKGEYRLVYDTVGVSSTSPWRCGDQFPLKGVFREMNMRATRRTRGGRPNG